MMWAAKPKSVVPLEPNSSKMQHPGKNEFEILLQRDCCCAAEKYTAVGAASRKIQNPDIGKILLKLKCQSIVVVPLKNCSPNDVVEESVPTRGFHMLINIHDSAMALDRNCKLTVATVDAWKMTWISTFAINWQRYTLDRKGDTIVFILALQKNLDWPSSLWIVMSNALVYWTDATTYVSALVVQWQYRTMDRKNNFKEETDNNIQPKKTCLQHGYSIHTLHKWFFNLATHWPNMFCSIIIAVVHLPPTR